MDFKLKWVDYWLYWEFIYFNIFSMRPSSLCVVPWVICFMFGGGVGVELFSCDKYLY